MNWQAYIDLAKQALDGDVPAGVMVAMIDESLAWSEAESQAFDERLAIQAIADGLTTTERALNALQVPDTRWGAHASAKAWLRDHEPTAGIFQKVGS